MFLPPYLLQPGEQQVVPIPGGGADRVDVGGAGEFQDGTGVVDFGGGGEVGFGDDADGGLGEVGGEQGWDLAGRGGGGV